MIVIITSERLRQAEGELHIANPGLSSLGVPGGPWHTQILADQLTLFQPGGTDYAHLITTGTPEFSDLPTALRWRHNNLLQHYNAYIRHEAEDKVTSHF